MSKLIRNYSTFLLESIWPKIRDQIDFGQDPYLIHAAAIRLWLNDPANAGRLAQITRLDLSRLGLKMLPRMKFAISLSWIAFPR